MIVRQICDRVLSSMLFSIILRLVSLPLYQIRITTYADEFKILVTPKMPPKVDEEPFITVCLVNKYVYTMNAKNV